VNEDRLRDLLRYRMRQADDSLREATILREADAQRAQSTGRITPCSMPCWLCWRPSS